VSAILGVHDGTVGSWETVGIGVRVREAGMSFTLLFAACELFTKLLRSRESSTLPSLAIGKSVEVLEWTLLAGGMPDRW
jgi:hypothetical protein